MSSKALTNKKLRSEFKLKQNQIISSIYVFVLIRSSKRDLEGAAINQTPESFDLFLQVGVDGVFSRL